MDETICLICGDLLSSRPTRCIKADCLKKCIKSSLRRKDAKHVEFRKYKSLEVHKTCSKTYVCESKILKCLKKLERPKGAGPARTTRSCGEMDFDNVCLFCSEDASDAFIERESKREVDRRNKVHLVTDNASRQSLLAMCDISSSRIGLQAHSRLLKTENLVAVRCRFHVKCYDSLRLRNIKFENNGAARTLVFEAAKFVANHLLEQGEECQFSVHSILVNFEGDSWPRMKYLKKHLHDILQDEIVVHPSRTDPTITYSAMGGTVLSKDFYTRNRVYDTNEERKRVVAEAAKIIVEDIRLQLYDAKSYPPYIVPPTI